MTKPGLMHIAFCSALCLLAACATPSEQVDLNDGGKGYRITCGGAWSSVSDCYEKAGKLCGNKGYNVVRENDIAPPSDYNFFWNAAAHETMIKCVKP